MIRAFIVVASLLGPVSSIFAAELQIGTSFFYAKEQAKGSSGQSGGALFTDRQNSLSLHGYFQLIPESRFSFGAFTAFELGNRRSCDYGGTDAAGVPQPSACRAGKYTQFWIGPSVQWAWRSLILQTSYIAYGSRVDEAYPTLQSPGGSDSTFRTHPLKAWVFTPGFKLELTEQIEVFLKLEYRYLYYSKRGGGELAQSQLYGNQAIRPHLGIVVRL